MKMNSFLGKKILSIIRDANYAHAGEEEAIKMVFQDIPKAPDRAMLDVGCGRGGTAHYLQTNAWGQVTGLDIEPSSIEFAREQYPESHFYACDIADIYKHIDKKFDLIYCFNSFYAFNDQKEALEKLQSCSNKNTLLLMFDYCDLGSYSETPIMNNDAPFLPYPLVLNKIGEMFEASGWQINETSDTTTQYERWYSELMANIEAKKAQIVDMGGIDAWESVNRLYGALLKSIQERKLGGIIIKAQKI